MNIVLTRAVTCVVQIRTVLKKKNEDVRQHTC
jgi:hypothetical protein